MSALVLFIATIFVAIIGVLPTDAYWIITHHPLVYERLDPILNPGGISGHTHAFVGSAALLPTANPNSSCTTSTVKADKSNYWQPALYYFNATNVSPVCPNTHACSVCALPDSLSLFGSSPGDLLLGSARFRQYILPPERWIYCRESEHQQHWHSATGVANASRLCNSLRCTQ